MFSDPESYACEELQKLKTTREKLQHYETMRKHANFSLSYYGHNRYWARLFESLEVDLKIIEAI